MCCTGKNKVLYLCDIWMSFGPWPMFFTKRTWSVTFHATFSRCCGSYSDVHCVSSCLIQDYPTAKFLWFHFLVVWFLAILKKKIQSLNYCILHRNQYCLATAHSISFHVINNFNNALFRGGLLVTCEARLLLSWWKLL